MRRFTFSTCLLGMLIFNPAARLWADELVPQPPARPDWPVYRPTVSGPSVSPSYRALEGLAGTWDTQISGGSAEALGQPASIGRITRQWVVDHKFLNERGRAHEAFITFDIWQSRFRAWYFHANGHVWQLSGPWTGTTDTLSLSAELDHNQSLTRTFQLLDDKRQECTVTWTDEHERSVVYGTLSYVRCEPMPQFLKSLPTLETIRYFHRWILPGIEPYDAETAGTAETPGTIRAASGRTLPSPPAEMKIFANEVGNWRLEGSVTTGEKTTKLKGTTVVQWNLDGQFLQSTTTIPERKGDTIYIAGFDTAARTYRCWYFDADTVLREPAVGSWDEKEQTMTWTYQLTSEFVMVSKKHWLNRDKAKLHGVCSRKDGSVYYTQDGTLTRQKEK